MPPRDGASSDVDPFRSWSPPLCEHADGVRIVLISECAAVDPGDDYGASPGSLFDETTLEAFAAAGFDCADIDELRAHGIHLTVAVRHPKTGATIGAPTIREHSVVLEGELAAFEDAVVYLLMGDVAIAAINQIARRRTGRRAIPAGATYRIRGGDFALGGVRLYPSYLQAGAAWRIEASKRRMIAEDIAAALAHAGIS